MSFFGRKLPPAGRWLLLFATALLLLLLVTALFLSGKSNSETESRIETRVDTLERQLEMERHEQLATLKVRAGSALTEFTTDGCSGGLSIGWEYLAGNIKDFQTSHGTEPPWESCCISHDRQYHTGGPRETTADESFKARKEADLALKSCVLETGLKRAPELIAEYDVSSHEVQIIYTGIADLMYRSVRIGGMPCTGLPWRWGYGWPECE
ncbi:MAG: hypothetical protein JRC69_03405 [Deltaproteobacteria bacterium]|nr:hypothetical protein [Deltaproteobacteria bacterium]